MLFKQASRSLNSPKFKRLVNMDPQTLRKEIQKSSRLNLKYKVLWDQYTYLVLKKSLLASKLKTSAFKPTDISLILESFSKIKVENTLFYKTLLKNIKNDIEKFDLRSISILFNALVKIKYIDLEVIERFQKVALDRITNTTSEKDLAILLNSLDQLGVDYTDIAVKSAILLSSRISYISNCQTLSMLFHTFSRISTDKMDEFGAKTELLSRVKKLLFDKCSKLIKSFRGYDYLLLYKACEHYSEGSSLQLLVVNRIVYALSEFKSHELVLIYREIYKKYPERAPHLLNELYYRLDNLSINYLFDLIQALSSMEMIRHCFNALASSVKKPWPSKRFLVDIMAWAHYSKFVHPTNEHARFFQASFNYFGNIKISYIADEVTEKEILKTAAWLRINSEYPYVMPSSGHPFGESLLFKYEYIQVPTVVKRLDYPRLFEKYLQSGKIVNNVSISLDKDKCIILKERIREECISDLRGFLDKIYPSKYTLEYKVFDPFEGHILSIHNKLYAIALTDTTNGNLGHDVIEQIGLVKRMGYLVYNINLITYYTEKLKKRVDTYFSLLLVQSNEATALRGVMVKKEEMPKCSAERFKSKLLAL